MIHNVVARRGIQALQLTHENRYAITDLVKGRLHQHARIDRTNPAATAYTYEVTFSRNGHDWKLKDLEWMLISPEGFVAIMDDDSFQNWFETASLQDALSASLTRRVDSAGDRA